MPEHGHEVCPHCEVGLVGAEATCPDCSGPLFGIAPKPSSVSESTANSGTTTIDNIAVPTYTPPATENQVHLSSDEVPEISRNEPQEMTVQDLVQQGEMLGIEGRHEDALKMFNQAISMDPNDHMAWFNRGVMSEATGDVQDAVKAFRIALDNNPSHGAASANLAVLLQRMGHPGDAVIHAQNGLIAFPGHPALLEIVNSAGAVVPVTPIVIDEPEIEDEVEVEMQESEPEQTWAEPQGLVKSLESHHAAVETEIIPEATPIQGGVDLDGLADAATAMIRTGDPAGALEMLRAHLPEAAAEHAPCWRVAAGAMARLELADAAINAFEYALDLEPEHASTWYNLGALKRRGEDIAGALSCFQNAFDRDHNYVKAANGIALAAMEMGQIELAMNGFRSLLSLDPSHEAGLTFAELLIDLAEGEGRVLELDATLPTTLPAGPDMAVEALRYLPESEHRLRARANTIAGEHAEAVTIWKGLLENDKDDSTLWLGLARSLSAAGSEDKAAACREKARGLGADVAEPVTEVAEAVESLPEPESAPVTEPSAQEVADEVDPWAAFSRPESDEVEVVEPQISTEEIMAHEAALDTVQEPERITYGSVSEEVDLAAAALEAQAGIMTVYEVQADSSSVANQDIEWYNKGIELLNKDRYKEALSCFDRALPSFKDDKGMAIKILNGRGNCFYYLNQFKEAIENYYKAFGIDKGLTTGNALYNMGTAYAELESYDNAIHCFNQSMGKDVGESLKGENKKRAKEQIRRCKLLLKEQNKRAA